MPGEEQRNDGRVERSRAKVLAETHRQLVRKGIAGVSIDEVSRSSGVSKTTIYRHWPSRSALLIEACSQSASVREPPDTGSFEKDARLYLSQLAEQLQSENWSSVYPSIIDAAERDEEIAALQAAMHRAFMTPLYAVIERGKARGEIASDQPPEHVAALLVGPLFYRRWFSKEAIDEPFIASIVRSVA